MTLGYKKLFASLVLAGVAGLSSMSASAGTFAATATSEGYSIDYTATTGAFKDYWSFDVVAPTTISASVSGTSSSAFSFTSFNLVEWVVDKYVLVAAGNVGNLTAKISFGGVEADDLGGKYFLEVIGTGKGGYSGTISVSAVPEAETYVMMLAGVGLMGFVARRRKTAYSAA
ncbi:FxDxF family PEP-CTERM protein [Methylovorus sp. MP688]|uniref:FxDxF family PEP-CTERM protein n=1 Tax=Methylovorus sp. (strain MP688) TaxID=887061 RepID=UPI001EE681C0|nr:FxDxF family PEP-CTERM protein [Methylovorus sp. MP688]